MKAEEAYGILLVKMRKAMLGALTPEDLALAITAVHDEMEELEQKINQKLSTEGGTLTGELNGTTINASLFTKNGTSLDDLYAAKSHTHSYLPFSDGEVTVSVAFNEDVLFWEKPYFDSGANVNGTLYAEKLKSDGIQCNYFYPIGSNVPDLINLEGVDNIILQSYNSTSKQTYGLYIGCEGTDVPSVRPTSNNAITLGDASYKWKQLYAVTSVISTSDRNQKKDIESLPDSRTVDFIMGLNPVQYKLIDGDSGRTHYGLISQDIEELLDSLGLNSMDFAGFIKSQKKEAGETASEGEAGTAEAAGYEYGLRYEEFIAPVIKMIQVQQHRIEELTERIGRLEEEHSALKSQQAE